MWRISSTKQIFSVHARKKGRSRQAGPPVHDDLVRQDFTATAPNTEWLTDITEQPTSEGKLYFCAVQGVERVRPHAVACALQLDEEEGTYLFDLAMAAQPASRTPRRRKAVDIPPRIQWLLDSMTLSAAFVTNGRLDMVASNALALFAPLFDSKATDERGRPNFARYWFLDRGAQDFAGDWDLAVNITAAMLCAEAGRYPNDKALRELIGELSTVSAEFRTRWAAHDVRLHHGGVNRFHHPDAGPLELTYQPLDLPISAHEAHSLTIYTAKPGAPDEDRLKLLAGWAATPAEHGNRPAARAHPEQSGTDTRGSFR